MPEMVYQAICGMTPPQHLIASVGLCPLAPPRPSWCRSWDLPAAQWGLPQQPRYPSQRRTWFCTRWPMLELGPMPGQRDLDPRRNVGPALQRHNPVTIQAASAIIAAPPTRLVSDFLSVRTCLPMPSQAISGHFGAGVCRCGAFPDCVGA